MMAIPTRDTAWELLTKWTQSEALRRHALTVEGVMRYFARRLGGDEELWGIIGLLHDIDYEKYPDQHCEQAPLILRQAGIDEGIIRAVVSHGYGIVNDVEPILPQEKVLYAVDELTGLIAAAAILRPSKSVMDLELKSVKKKYKQPSFAAGVDRTVIENGAQMLGMTLDELIEQTILGMRGIASDIGLAG